MRRIKIYLNRNIQIIYFWIFILVLLVPNFIILDMAPKPYYMLIPFVLIPMAIYTFFMSLSRKPGYMLIFAFPFIFLGAFQLALITMFKSSVIGADMFTNIFTTNTSEAGDVLRTMLFTLCCFVVLYGGAYTLCYYSIKSHRTRSKKFHHKIIIGSVMMIIIGVIFIFVSYNKNPHYSTIQDIFPLNVVNNLSVSTTRWKMSKNYPKTSEGFVFDATKQQSKQREVYVLVVGESARADKLSIYGYSRETTPNLKALGDTLIIMTDAVTQSNTTHKSTALIMSSASAVDFEKAYTQKSLVSAFNEAGFKTMFISNQVAKGSFMDLYAAEASNRMDMPNRKENDKEFVDYDIHTLKHVKEYIESTTENVLIVVHTYGSHLQYHDRYPKEFEKWTPASSTSIAMKDKTQLNNAYDNTILYTDYFLSEVIKLIDSEDVCSGILYLSDHGEDLLDDERARFMHSSPTLTYYQLHIPFLMWISPEYKEEYPQKYDALLCNRTKSISSSSVFHTMLDMANIKTSYLDTQESIISQQYKEKDRMFLNDLYKPMYFGNMELNKLDFEQFEKHNIKYNSELIK